VEKVTKKDWFMDADILASCAVIIGVDQAKLMLKGNGVTDFLLQSENNNIFEGSLIRGYS
jgi:hypothetical protein